VYGANYGPWSSIPANALEDYQQSGLTMLRFPGGNWGDDDFVRPNHVDMYKMFLEMIDGQPIVTVNLREGTPEQAVELMQMMEEKGIDVTYWSIGNEPNLFANRLNNEHWDTEFYNQQWREFATAMKAHNPNIQLIGPDLSQYTAVDTQNPQDANGRDWMREFLRTNGDMVDIVSFHRYPFGGSPTIPEVKATTTEWDAILPHLRSVIQEETGTDKPISIMEINSNWSHATGGEATPDSFYNAIWWADSFGRIINQGTDMVAFFTLAHNDGTTLLHRDGPRPTSYVYQLYQQYGTEKVHTHSNTENVSIFAARRADDALTLMITNTGTEPVTAPLQINGFEPNSTELWRFDKDHLAENLGAITWQNGDSLTIPGESITLLILQP
jgi:hypothetical protein